MHLTLLTLRYCPVESLIEETLIRTRSKFLAWKRGYLRTLSLVPIGGFLRGFHCTLYRHVWKYTLYIYIYMYIHIHVHVQCIMCMQICTYMQILPRTQNKGRKWLSDFLFIKLGSFVVLQWYHINDMFICRQCCWYNAYGCSLLC